jgi:hypothetical protein
VNRWLLLKDVSLTGTGLFVILSQIFSLHPNGLLLGTGLALTVPTIAEHVKALLPSGGGESSSSTDSRPPPRSGPSAGSPR